MRKSVPRQVDKSGVPEEEKGAWGSRGGDWGLESSRGEKVLGCEMPVEEHQAPWKQGDTAESIVVRSAITIASFSPTHQHRQLNNREPGQSSA